MISSSVESGSPGHVVRFPSRRVRTEFLEQVRLWNRLEALPDIVAEPLVDGFRVRFWSGDSRRAVIWKLVDSYGGRTG